MKSQSTVLRRILPFLLAASLPLVGAAADSGATPAPTSRDSDALSRCIKLLNYGGENGYYNASKSDAVVALGMLRDEAAIPTLVDHLENESNNNLRLQIVRALGWIGSAKAVPALERALQDKYPHVRKVAAMGLKEITGKDYDYDKTGLPDPQKMREMLTAAARESGQGAKAPAPPAAQEPRRQ